MKGFFLTCFFLLFLLATLVIAGDIIISWEHNNGESSKITRIIMLTDGPDPLSFLIKVSKGDSSVTAEFDRAHCIHTISLVESSGKRYPIKLSKRLNESSEPQEIKLKYGDDPNFSAQQ